MANGTEALSHIYIELEETLSKAMPQLFSGNIGANIPLGEVEDQQGIERTIDYALYIRKVGLYRDERIGVIDPNLSRMYELEGLIRGDVVLYRNIDQKRASVSIVTPLNLAATEAQKVPGPLFSLRIPLGYIRPIGPAR